jgi:hypothetical protein
MTATAIVGKKERLLDNLQKAIVLELATLPPYLTAMWSIHPGTNREASSVIRSVFMEEMLHMTLAGNILSAIGGKPSLGPETIPKYPLELEMFSPRKGERVLDVHLARFSPATMETFMQIELPANMTSPHVLAAAPEIVLPGFTIGEFYGVIKDLLQTLNDEIGSAALFNGNPRHQISEEFYWKGGGHPVVVTSLETALEAIDVITEQGEGADGSLFDGDRHFFGQPEEVAHYFRFKQIVAGRYYAPTDSIFSEPSGAPLPVDFGAVFPIKADCVHADFASSPALSAMSEKFNAGYTMMLQQLMEGFAGNPPVFYTAIMNGMLGLSDVAREMVRIPIPGDPEQQHAAPTFQWTDPYMGH